MLPTDYNNKPGPLLPDVTAVVLLELMAPPPPDPGEPAEPPEDALQCVVLEASQVPAPPTQYLSAMCYLLHSEFMDMRI